MATKQKNPIQFSQKSFQSQKSQKRPADIDPDLNQGKGLESRVDLVKVPKKAPDVPSQEKNTEIERGKDPDLDPEDGHETEKDQDQEITNADPGQGIESDPGLDIGGLGIGKNLVERGKDQLLLLPPPLLHPDHHNFCSFRFPFHEI